jgi:hypothetical protein
MVGRLFSDMQSMNFQLVDEGKTIRTQKPQYTNKPVYWKIMSNEVTSIRFSKRFLTNYGPGDNFCLELAC